MEPVLISVLYWWTLQSSCQHCCLVFGSRCSHPIPWLSPRQILGQYLFKTVLLKFPHAPRFIIHQSFYPLTLCHPKFSVVFKQAINGCLLAFSNPGIDITVVDRYVLMCLFCLCQYEFPASCQFILPHTDRLVERRGSVPLNLRILT